MQPMSAIRPAMASILRALPSSSRVSRPREPTNSSHSRPPSSKPSVRKPYVMSGETVPFLPDDFGSLKRGRYTYFPVVPGRMEFAIAVREAILRDRPQVVAVELPSTLESSYLWAVRRLPQMSVIFYAADEQGGPGGDEAVYIPVEP